MKKQLIAVLLAIASCSASLSAEPTRKTVWQGVVHLGDNPMQFSSVNSAGMLMQIPCAIDSAKKGKLVITTRDVQTLSGDGHYAELMAHYEDGDGPAREYVVETFRLKGDSNNVDIDHAFEFDPMKDLQARPAYYSVRIKIDTQIKFSLWDDFLMKRIDVEQ